MKERLMKELDTIKAMIPWQTYKTIIGQINAGDTGGAKVGIDRLKRKIAKGASEYAHSNR